MDMEWLFGPGLLFRNAVLGGILVALLCSVLGVYLVLRRIVLLGVALPQAGAAGIAAAFWLTAHAHDPDGGHASALFGSFAATFGALALLLFAGRDARRPAEWQLGGLLAVASAVTVLFVALNPTGDLEVTNLLRGELLATSDGDLVVLGVASALALGLFALFHREILLASFDPEFARTLGRDPLRADLLLFGLLGLVIALGVMFAGPLVVFGFLVLPALAALRVASSLWAAIALAALLGVTTSVGGFLVAYRADLPTGPVSVSLVASVWLLFAMVERLRVRWGAAAAVLGVGLALGPHGCASAPARAAWPALAEGQAITVAPPRNETGQALRIPSGNPLAELRQAVGRAPAQWTVPDALQAMASQLLAAHGVPVQGFEADRATFAAPPSGPADAARVAREAGLVGPVLVGRLSRFTLTGTGLLLVRLDLALVDVASGEVLWQGAARDPVPVRSALQANEVVLDAGPVMLAEAFGWD